MDKQSTVVFQNVGQVYFPQTKVECHYTLISDHKWSSSDWIGIFETGWSSVKQYYTYTWALVPEGHADGVAVNCCALFPAYYLPRPSVVQYQFVYVDKTGQVCACSQPFTFCDPKPLEELETLKEEREEEDGEEELLLVVPRAQLLQSRLEESSKKQADLQQALNAAVQEAKKEKVKIQMLKTEWKREREQMKEEILELRDKLRQKSEQAEETEGKLKGVQLSEESLTCQLSGLKAQTADSEHRIKDLEGDVRVLTEEKDRGTMELERLKDRLKKMSTQMKHSEEKRKSLQVENEAGLVEVRGLQEKLDMSEHVSECLRRELRELATRKAQIHTELHQARMHVAQLTLQLSEENLVLREERASWALEREAHKQAAETANAKMQELSSEVQRKEEWLQEERTEREKLDVELSRNREQNRVLLNDAHRELQKLRDILRKVQTEREQQYQTHASDLQSYIQQLQQRLGTETEMTADREASPMLLAPESSFEDDTVPEAQTHTQSKDDTEAADAQNKPMQAELPAHDRKQPVLPELIDPVLRQVAKTLGKITDIGQVS